MLAHRDYINYMAAARLQLFRDRISWISPGGLLPGITVDTILSLQSSRNPVLCSILYEANYGEAVGQGLYTVVSTLAEENLPAPRFVDSKSAFMVTVFGH